MSELNCNTILKDSTEDLFKHTSGEFACKIQAPYEILLPQNIQLNPHGIFLTHEQKIQATYNFQSLFRKKSHIYNLHKNKKKMLSKNAKNDHLKDEYTDKYSKNVKKGHWSEYYNRKYHWFLYMHNKNFIQKHLRRTDKIFKAMSSFIGSRYAYQCRSHHQKMYKKYKNFYQILIKLRMYYYGACGTELLKRDLEEHNYMKGGENEEMLIDENMLKAMEHCKEEVCEGDDERSERKGIDDEEIMPIHYHEYKYHEDEHYDQIIKEKPQVNFFFTENYEKQFNYKLY